MSLAPTGPAAPSRNAASAASRMTVEATLVPTAHRYDVAAQATVEEPNDNRFPQAVTVLLLAHSSAFVTRAPPVLLVVQTGSAA